MSTLRKQHIYSVDDLNAELKKLLEMSYADVWVEGEVSSLAQPPSGHHYFTLKDNNSLLKCVLFKNRAYLASCLPVEGERILVRGKVSVYSARGDIQLICRYVEAAGEGELRRRFEALKNSLRAEGLFDESHKQKLPAYPRKVALITSSHGAVLHDILTTFRQRYPLLELTIYSASVQGEQAKSDIIQALTEVENSTAEIIILARGGGSLEDLQIFNEEALARAIFACSIPVVSAIGHETDFVISDFVADMRAPTPTAAATLITPDINDLKSSLQQLRKLLDQRLTYRLNTKQQQVDLGRQALKHPSDRLALHLNRLQGLKLRLQSTTQSRLASSQRQMIVLQSRLSQLSPKNRLNTRRTELSRIRERLEQLIQNRLSAEQARLSRSNTALQAYSPLKTLARGYSITQTEAGDIVRMADQAKMGDKLSVRLHRGKLDVIVKDPQVPE